MNRKLSVFTLLIVLFVVSLFVGGETNFASVEEDNFSASIEGNGFARVRATNLWHIETVDSAGDVGKYTSIALDSNDNPHISYYDATTTGNLKYAYYDGSQWHTETVEHIYAGLYTSIALDSYDHPHISYYDVSFGDLHYAYHDGDSWVRKLVDSDGDVGKYTSIALDSYDHPHISYYDYYQQSGVDDGDLKYAFYNGSTWQTNTVHSRKNTGLYTSIALDSYDHPHISHYRNRYPYAPEDYYNDLLYTYYDGTWHTEKVDGTCWCEGTCRCWYETWTSIAIDPNDNPHISYSWADLEVWENYLKYAHHDGTEWRKNIVDSYPEVGEYSSIALSGFSPHISHHYKKFSGHLRYTYYEFPEWHTEIVDDIADIVGAYTSIALNSIGDPHISYYDVTNGNLKYACRAYELTITTNGSGTTDPAPGTYINKTGIVVEVTAIPDEPEGGSCYVFDHWELDGVSYVPTNPFPLLMDDDHTLNATFIEIPHVDSVLPTQNKVNVPSSTDISVTFNCDMDGTSINETTFIVNTRSKGRVDGTVSYNSGTRTATFDPNDDFDEGDVVTVMLTNEIKYYNGAPIQSYAWSFTIVVNEGHGAFALHSNYTLDDSPFSIFAADLDGDGDMDLATANWFSDTVSVLLNYGDGTFAPPVDYPVGKLWVEFYPGNDRSIFAADLDGDGDMDLATANRGDSNVSVLLNYGDGTFGPYSYYSVGDRPEGEEPVSIFAADLDGDGDMDLATANCLSDTVAVLLNDGNGAFPSHSNYAVRSAPESIFTADLDNDGDLDLVTVGMFEYVCILLNYGDGTFGPYYYYDLGFAYSAISIFAADLDGDGDMDLATANSDDDNVSVLLNDGDGTFSSHLNYPTGRLPHTVFAADLDGDGDLDLATGNSGSFNISVLLNNGDGTFASHSDYPVDGYPVSVFAADLDGDGDLDLATGNGYGFRNVSVSENRKVFNPIAVFSYSGYYIVKFDASTSYDPDGSIVSYRWDFGDGTIITESDPIVYHMYDNAGTYTVILTVTDNDGLTDDFPRDVPSKGSVGGGKCLLCRYDFK